MLKRTLKQKAINAMSKDKTKKKISFDLMGKDDYNESQQMDTDGGNVLSQFLFGNTKGLENFKSSGSKFDPPGLGISLQNSHRRNEIPDLKLKSPQHSLASSIRRPS